MFSKISWKTHTALRRILALSRNANFWHCLLLYPLWSVPNLPCYSSLISSLISQVGICQIFYWKPGRIFPHFILSETNYLYEEKHEIRQEWLAKDKFLLSPIFSSIYWGISIHFQFLAGLLKVSPFMLSRYLCLINRFYPLLNLCEFLPDLKDFYFSVLV